MENLFNSVISRTYQMRQCCLYLPLKIVCHICVEGAIKGVGPKDGLEEVWSQPWESLSS